MTRFSKRVLTAAVLAVGVLATGSPARASFQFTYTPVSGNAGSPVTIINTATPAGPTNFVSAPAPPGAALILLDPTGAGAGRLISISWDITDNPTAAAITVNNITIQYNGTVPSAPVEFNLEIIDNGGSIPAGLGNNLTAVGFFNVFGGTDQPPPFNFATTSTVRPEGTISQTGQVPNPVTVTIVAPIPNLPLGYAPLLPGGGSVPPVGVNFTRGTSGLVTTRLFANIRLQGYTNATIEGSIRVVQNVVPAPAGLVLAGLGLPALGLATRLRRRATV